jgi:hypothetical protein
MPKTTVKIKKLPTLVLANDYHEFQFIQNTFEDVGLSLKVEELGFDYGGTFSYVGLVYAGKRPAKKRIDQLVAKEGISFEDDE